MALEPIVIPEKIYFKIGEVCDLLGVQPHVLRYWETEFPMLSPQKNKSGQRSYRRRDVEIAVRIKQLLYNEMFTIAGARKKLQTEQREGSRSRSAPQQQSAPPSKAPGAPTLRPDQHPMLFDTSPEQHVTAAQPSGNDHQTEAAPATTAPVSVDHRHREVLRTVAGQLLELREILRTPNA